MQIVGAGLGYKIVDAPCTVAVLRGDIEAKLLEFLDGVLNRSINDASHQGLVRDTVDEKPIKVLAQSVHNRVMTTFEVHPFYIHRPRPQLHEALAIASIQL